MNTYSPDHPEKPDRIKYILENLKNKIQICLRLKYKSVQKWIKEIHLFNNSLKKDFPLAEKFLGLQLKFV